MSPSSRLTRARRAADAAGQAPWRLAIVVFSVLLAATGCAPAARDTGTTPDALPVYDLLIRGGTVVDGTGAERFVADVAIRGDRIIAVEPPGELDAVGAAEVIEAVGLVVAPGFIDQHAHVQTSIHRYPLAENFTRQGITTILASLHSGSQPWLFGEYLDALEVAPNVGFFAGHTWTRRQVLGNERALLGDLAGLRLAGAAALSVRMWSSAGMKREVRNVLGQFKPSFRSSQPLSVSSSNAALASAEKERERRSGRRCIRERGPCRSARDH